MTYPRSAPLVSGLGSRQAGLLHGRSCVQRAQFKLSRYSKKKKAFPVADLECKICTEKGHTDHFCPAAGSDPPLEERIPFVEQLLALPREDIQTLYEGLSPGEVMARVQDRGRVLNTGNPWVESTARRDKLRSKLGHWKAIGCDSKILSWLAYGRMLRFHTNPEEVSFPNAKSVNDNQAFVDKECKKALDEGSAVCVDLSYARIINPILVNQRKRNLKLRLCLDLRHANSMTAHSKFRLASLLKNLPYILREGDILFTADLEQAYHSVPMHHSAWPFLVFNSPGFGLMAPTVLSFGDGVAPFTFHKLPSPW